MPSAICLFSLSPLLALLPVCSSSPVSYALHSLSTLLPSFTYNARSRPNRTRLKQPSKQRYPHFFNAIQQTYAFQNESSHSLPRYLCILRNRYAIPFSSPLSSVLTRLPSLAQFFPLSLYSVSSLTSLTKRALSDYTPSFVSFASSDPSPTDDGSATYLPDIIQASTVMCQSKCHVVSRTLAGCLRSGADYDILKCSCSDTTLARVCT